MKKTCTNCGGQEFHVVMKTRLKYPRKPSMSETESYTDAVKCVECQEEYTL